MSTYNNYFVTYKQIKKHRVQLIIRATLGVIFNRRLNINLQFLSPYSEYYSSSAPTSFDFRL